MTWADFYLVCFVVGLALSLMMFVGGMHWHLPFHFHFHGHHAVGHGAAHGHSGASPFNLLSLSDWAFCS